MSCCEDFPDGRLCFRCARTRRALQLVHDGLANGNLHAVKLPHGYELATSVNGDRVEVAIRVPAPVSVLFVEFVLTD